MIWSDHAVAQCKRLYIAEGRSASETARALGGGCTSNAVVGKAHRMGWLKVSRQAASKPARAPSVARSHVRPPSPGPQSRPAAVFGVLSQSASTSTAAVRAERAAEGRESIARVEITTVQSPGAKPFLEARGGCKWPIGEGLTMMSCCNPIDRGSYCEGHADIAYSGRIADRKMRNGASINARSVIEQQAIWHTRFERLDEYVAIDPKKGRPVQGRTTWDEGRAAA